MTMNNIIPSQTIGIIGGGQLGRMMAIAAKYMGYHVVVLDPTVNGPTAQVADKQIIAPYDDLDSIEQLAEMSDVITYEFENVDRHAAAYIEQQGKLPQGVYALEITQNRENEKTLMREVHLPVAPFHIIRNGMECKEVLEKFPYPAVIKTCSGGYDGKGQLKITSSKDKTAAIEFADQHGHCIIEKWVDFDKEISVIFTRTKQGGIEFFPIAENEHEHHILYKTTAPARISEEIKIKAFEAAKVLADKMDVVGTFAIEMFVAGEAIYINEMAPRPHNSGHYTIEACNISQFAQHIRAICGLPLIRVEQLAPAVMINILGEDMDDILKVLPKTANGFIHLYGKSAKKAKRKMGHVTFIGETTDEQIKQFEEAKQ